MIKNNTFLFFRAKKSVDSWTVKFNYLHSNYRPAILVQIGHELGQQMIKPTIHGGHVGGLTRPWSYRVGAVCEQKPGQSAKVMLATNIWTRTQNYHEANLLCHLHKAKYVVLTVEIELARLRLVFIPEDVALFNRAHLFMDGIKTYTVISRYDELE